MAQPSDGTTTSTKIHHRSIITLLVVSVFGMTAILWDPLQETFSHGASAHSSTPNARFSLQDLLMEACHAIPDDCKSDLFELVGRKFVATQDIEPGTKLLSVPREMKILDLDALREPFVRENLFQARRNNKKDISNEAFLAAYMALVQNDVVQPAGIRNDYYKAYLQGLPSYDEFASYHPVLATDLEAVAERLGGAHTSEYQRIVTAKEDFESEYDAFASASEEFSSHISREDYLAARLSVHSRSFGMAKVAQSEALPNVNFSLETELKYYLGKIGWDFAANGHTYMFPVIDMLNSHIHPNVHLPAQTMETLKRIPKGAELVFHYGSDNISYSSFGYVDADGSVPTIAKLHPHHDVVGTKQNPERPTKEELVNYLAYDYGYPTCIKTIDDGEEDTVEVWLKRLKLRYLELISLDRLSWEGVLPPRNPSKRTPFYTIKLPEDYTVPTIDAASIKEHLDDMLGGPISLPCKLIALHHEDLGGDTMGIVTEDIKVLTGPNAATETLQLEKIVPVDEWRTRMYMCIRQMANMELSKYHGPSIVAEEEAQIQGMFEAGQAFTWEWNAAHVKLREMQSLKAIVDHIDGMNSKRVLPEAHNIRWGACPNQDSFVE